VHKYGSFINEDNDETTLLTISTQMKSKNIDHFMEKLEDVSLMPLDSRTIIQQMHS
jgi:hypothetical protein